MGELEMRKDGSMKGKNNYSKITYEQYASLFGLNNPEKEDLHKAALKKAWETRNFEIDKFWQRSAFFWGFIVLIFGGYVTIATGKNNETAKEMYLDFYLILLGIIFSVAWFLAICGSKRWQENWEKHIDNLEDEITGPLYKSLYFKRKKYYYSVSKMNKIPAGVVIVTWIFLLIQYLCNNYNIIKNIFLSFSNNFKVFLFILLPFLGTVFCVFYLMLYKGQTDDGKLNSELRAELEKGEDNAFFIKD
jgi:preprotein translocase subunit YajC